VIEDPDGVLADYHRWLYKVAHAYARNPGDVDDIAQEGRVAMWRAMETFDGDRGSLPSWLTTAAKARMRDVAFRGRPATGHRAARHHAEARPAVSLDAFEQEEAERVFDLVDTLDLVERAYMCGVVAKALESLTPRQREYVFLRFFAGLETTSALPSTVALRRRYPVLQDRRVWAEARRALEGALS
jgi:RNA polymerase sigma factor (sigma-70 family)